MHIGNNQSLKSSINRSQSPANQKSIVTSLTPQGIEPRSSLFGLEWRPPDQKLGLAALVRNFWWQKTYIYYTYNLQQVVLREKVLLDWLMRKFYRYFFFSVCISLSLSLCRVLRLSCLAAVLCCVVCCLVCCLVLSCSFVSCRLVVLCCGCVVLSLCWLALSGLALPLSCSGPCRVVSIVCLVMSGLVLPYLMLNGWNVVPATRMSSSICVTDMSEIAPSLKVCAPFPPL